MAKFEKGVSGNPAGKPKGAKDKRTALRAMLEPHAKDLVKTVVEKALEGDTTALRLCIDRLMPALKAKDEPIVIDGLLGTATLVEQGQSVITALALGKVSPSDASTLMSTIAAQAKITEIDDLERRVTELEQTKGRYEHVKKKS
ncbi:MAG: hypothetical protein COB23_07155 [Methylophaga sp.]|nr:MAG: hypothetical protein COB23_07155 [Methylophaga sp.]